MSKRVSRRSSVAASRVPVEYAEWRIDQLTPHPKNVRRHPTSQIELLERSLSRHGQYRPIVVQRSTGYILAGHAVYEAARRLGWETVRVAVVDVDAEGAAQLMVVDNRSAELSHWDIEQLTALVSEFDSLEAWDFLDNEFKELLAWDESDFDAAMDALSSLPSSSSPSPSPSPSPRDVPVSESIDSGEPMVSSDADGVGGVGSGGVGVSRGSRAALPEITRVVVLELSELESALASRVHEYLSLHAGSEYADANAPRYGARLFVYLLSRYAREHLDG